MKQIKFKVDRLKLIVFSSGAIVMILELIGSRILAPYLGTSIFVWASLIGIILGALSLGYYWGGYFSKENPRLAFLTKILFFAGLAILLITLIKEPILHYSMKLGVKSGSVLATLILFALPSILLGMISPYAIRLKIENIEGSGGIAGNLYALSTVGSIFGTFLAGFYLIPAFGSSQILFGLSFILLLLALLTGGKKANISVLILTLLLWVSSYLIPSPYVLETDSAYNHIRVLDTTEKNTGEKIRILLLATETHSIIYLDSDKLFAAYHKLYQLDSLFNPKIQKALTLGGGAYVAPMNFLQRWPEAEMTVVEIDPKVTEVAKNYFWLKENPRLKIIHQDGRIFLNSNTKKFDAIYGDAFASYFSIPFQLTTKEAAEKMYNLLADDGILILNVISSLEGKKSEFFQAEYKTLKEYFGQIYVFLAHYPDAKDTEKRQNIILIAAKTNDRLTKEELAKKATAQQKDLLEHLWPEEIILDPKTKILTDEFAPVDYYISKLL